jgi:thioredoxin 1
MTLHIAIDYLLNMFQIMPVNDSYHDFIGAILPSLLRTKAKFFMTQSFDNLIGSEQPIIVNFYNPSNPSGMAASLLKQIKKIFEHRIKIVRVDIDKYSDLAIKYDVSNNQSLLLFQNGKQLWKRSGATSIEDIIGAILDKNFAKSV